MSHRQTLFGKLRRLRGSREGYAIAGASLVFALALRWAVDPWITIPFVTMFPAIVIAGLFGGRVAGIAVAALGGVVTYYLWVEPRNSFAMIWPSGFFNSAGYVLTSAILLVLVRFLNEALDDLERERDRANHLFAELQHRTANVMQSVAVLLRQGLARVKHDPTASDVLKVAQSRFDAMASIHRRLYSPQSRNVSLDDLISGLCHDLLVALGVTAEVDVYAENKELEHRKLFSLCVLVAELVINSTKHAFRDKPGKIAIRLTENRGLFKLAYADNGPGLPEGFSLNGPSLGGRVLTGLALQLGGELQAFPGLPGARFEISFPGS